MEQGLRAKAAVLGAAVFFTLTQAGFSAPPRVPSLPAQLAEYVKYAVTDLPNHYKNPAIANTDNTPAANPITDAGATLGRVLFYDKRMSHGDGVSCASCHQQAHGFSDPNQFSTGFDGQQTGRHSMGISNAVYYDSGKAFWDERAASLEDQALMPIQSPVEMGMTLPVLVEKLSATTYYPTLFQAAFGTSEITPERIGQAIAQFERSMVSYQSKYDAAIAAENAGNADPYAVLNEQEVLGRQLFHGEGKCSQCHRTEAMIGDVARNIGLDDGIVDPDTEPNGEDAGAGNGRFKTTSLRNVGVRERFMHDGRHEGLTAVVEFYNSEVQAHPYLDNRLKNLDGTPLRLNWDETEIAAVVAFLHTLTDEEFLNDAKFSDPFAELPGDYSGDGTVGPEDYDVWKENFGDTELLTADGNGDLVVDAADYTVWRNNFGRIWMDLVTGSGSLGVAAPEPTGLALIVAALGAGLACHRRPRR